MDVGHGASTAVVLPGRHVVLIDTGPKQAYRRVLGRLILKSAERLTLVLTHSHRDHCGSAAKLLRDFTGEVESVWLPDDDATDGSLLDTIADVLGSDAPRLVNRLEANATSDCGVVDDIPLDGGDRMVFAILSPRMLVARGSQRGESGPDRRNAGSGIIRVDRRSGNDIKTRVVVGGDADLDRWRDLSPEILQNADVLVVPHHGGLIAGGADKWKEFSGLVPSGSVFFSVATKSTAAATRHPRPDAVTAFRDAGCRVFCSQLTHGCCDDPRAFAGVGPTEPAVCSGHQRVRMGANGVEFPDADVAAERVAAVAAAEGGHPLCSATSD